MSIGSIFSKNPSYPTLDSFLMSFFEFGIQILKFFFRKEVFLVSPFKNIRFVTRDIFIPYWNIERVCESLIDAFYPQSFLIAGAISQHRDWMRNGRRKKLEE